MSMWPGGAGIPAGELRWVEVGRQIGADLFVWIVAQTVASQTCAQKGPEQVEPGLLAGADPGHGRDGRVRH